ncbi:hypothetical protein [Companilactobacillus kimchiensis]|nr:hypothetical protein [Companilactobacillus kimchiensis]
MTEIDKAIITYLEELTVEPNSMATSLVHVNKIHNLQTTLEEASFQGNAKAKDALEIGQRYSNKMKLKTDRANSVAKEKSTFDPMTGVKATDWLGNDLSVTVKPTWVDQTKSGTTRLTYRVSDRNKQVHYFNREVTVLDSDIKISGINDIDIPYLK